MIKKFHLCSFETYIGGVFRFFKKYVGMRKSGRLLLFIVFSFAILPIIYINLFSTDIDADPYILTPTTITLRTRPLVPKILHRTYATANIPEKWLGYYEHCQRIYPEYQHLLWTDESARMLIESEYPFILSIFDGYRYPIQRADVIRYIVLYHYGGIYMDLDIGCALNPTPRTNLTNLLGYGAILPKTKPIGFSNDVLVSTRKHAFFKYLISGLKTSNVNLFFPYLTVFFSTGPMYLTFKYYLYEYFLRSSESIWVIGSVLYSEGQAEERMFRHTDGSSWHGWDAHIIKFFYGNLSSFIIHPAGLLLIIIILYTLRRKMIKKVFKSKPY